MSELSAFGRPCFSTRSCSEFETKIFTLFDQQKSSFVLNRGEHALSITLIHDQYAQAWTENCSLVVSKKNFIEFSGRQKNLSGKCENGSLREIGGNDLIKKYSVGQFLSTLLFNHAKALLIYVFVAKFTLIFFISFQRI